MTTIVRRNGKGSQPAWPGFMDNFFGRDLFDLTNSAVAGSTMPSVNISENNDMFLVDVAAPGLNKNDFKVSLENNLLSISSEKESSDETQDSKYTRKEFTYSSFKRTFSIPDNVESNKIRATYKDGILRLEIPKKEEAKQKEPRLISIS